MPELGDTLSFSEAIRMFNELEHELLSNVFAPDHMNKVKMCEFSRQSREAVEKYGIEKSEMLDGLRKLTHELTVERVALANGRDGDRFYLITEGSDVANYASTHFLTVWLDSELLQKRFHELLSILDKEM